MTSLILQNNERFCSLSRLVVVVGALTPFFFCHRGKAFVKSSNRSRTKQQQFGVNHFPEFHSSDVLIKRVKESSIFPVVSSRPLCLWIETEAHSVRHEFYETTTLRLRRSYVGFGWTRLSGGCAYECAPVGFVQLVSVYFWNSGWKRLLSEQCEMNNNIC